MMGMRAGILAVDYTLGSIDVTHEQLEERFGEEAMKKVLTGSGIRNRKVAAPGVCGSDLAFDAADRLLNERQIDRASIDLLIHCTQSPDYFMPTTACLLHERLGLKKDCAAFDINLGCSQYVYALSVASSMIQAGVATRALVLTGDTVSHTVHPQDRAVVPIMGDGGSATLVGQVPEGQGFLAFELGTDGTGHKYLMIPAGGSRNPISKETAVETTDAEGNTRTQQNLYMNGAAIFHFAITVVPKTVNAILAKLDLTIADIDLFLFHQANQYMLDYLVKKLKIPQEKTHFFLSEIGNTSGSTMPTVLTDAIRAGKVKPGSRVLMIVFGVGLSWGATVMTWPEAALPA
jgi:3-oxoacyl-[acyl-carrier-protein] synthase III